MRFVGNLDVNSPSPPCLFNERVDWTNLSIPNPFSKCVNSMKWPWKESRLTHNGVLVESHLALMGAVGQFILPSWCRPAVLGTCCSAEPSSFIALSAGCCIVRRKEEITLSLWWFSLRQICLCFICSEVYNRIKMRVQSVKQSKIEFC